MLSYLVFNRRDIIEDVTYTTPFGFLEMSSNGGTVFIRMPSGDEFIFTSWGIESLAEGEIWKESTNGFRLPAALFEIGRAHV